MSRIPLSTLIVSIFMGAIIMIVDNSAYHGAVVFLLALIAGKE